MSVDDIKSSMEMLIEESKRGTGISDYGQGRLMAFRESIEVIEQLQSTNADLQKRVEEFENSEDMSSGCFSMIEEALVACGEVMKAVPPMCYDDKIRSAVGKRNKRIKELDAEVAGLKEVIKEALGFVSEKFGDYPEPDEELNRIFSVLEKALSAPTSSKLLAKIEAGEKLKVAAKEGLLWANQFYEKHPESKILPISIEIIKSALSAYRAAFKGEPKKESEAGK